MLLFRYIRILEDACKLHYFVQFGSSAVLICVISYMLSTVRLYLKECA